MKDEVVCISKSEKETIELGKKIGTLLKKGDVVALMGDLGSGKTYLTKGIAHGLGINQGTIITSPTFILVNEYEGRYKLYHIDLYRIKDPDDARSSGLEEYIISQDGVVVIEWADLCPDILPQHYISVKLEIIGDSERRIEISTKGEAYFTLLEKIKTSIEER